MLSPKSGFYPKNRVIIKLIRYQSVQLPPDDILRHS